MNNSDIPCFSTFEKHLTPFKIYFCLFFLITIFLTSVGLVRQSINVKVQKEKDLFLYNKTCKTSLSHLSSYSQVFDF